MSQAHFWMEKWEHVNCCQWIFLWHAIIHWPKTFLHAARVANVSGSSLWPERAKPPLASSWQIACCGKIQIWGLRPLVCPFGGTKVVGTRWNWRPLPAVFPWGFSDGVVNGWVMMGSFVSVLFGFILQGVTVVWATRSIHICKFLFWRLWGLRKLPSYLWIHLNRTATAEGTFPSKIHEIR